MLKSLLALSLLLACLLLTACTTTVGNLNRYIDSKDGYQFSYPNGWVQVDVRDASAGVDAVFRDIVERTENLSVIISEVPAGKTLPSLGTPTEVGYRFLKSKSGQASDREAEFITAAERDQDGQVYYELEYEVSFPDRAPRHNLASVAVSRGKLFTFNISTSQARWEKIQPMFQAVADSFQVY
ncbi:MAG: photosystem II oxygen evolving complex protein PsbP [Spirulinaceae cyanobacterium RM2_2_10]|nr:photosystem II oxygen evolving complex protein PsbP [Spirulinaceae cyanobacterium SM2_1_0]NJO21166.1 photosystem II oxygen evolving complex protein PsbP [Spirulinaceae cyanobacterium RM2_2_10]